MSEILIQKFFNKIVNWTYLSQNPCAIYILKVNLDRIDLEWLSSKTGIF